MAKLILPEGTKQVAEKEMPTGARKTILQVAPEAKIGFYAVVEAVPSRQFEQGTDYLTRYVKRDTSNWPLMVQENWCYDMPPAFHACLIATATLLHGYHTQPKKLEGELDQSYNPRQIIQGMATHYGVDPNELAGFYPRARLWLGVPHYTHPETLGGLINFMIGRAKQTVH